MKNRNIAPLSHCNNRTCYGRQMTKWSTKPLHSDATTIFNSKRKLVMLHQKLFNKHIQLFRNDTVDIVHVCEFNDFIVNVCFACYSFRILVDLTLIISELVLILCLGVIFSKSYPLRFLRFSLCLASFCPLRLP